MLPVVCFMYEVPLGGTYFIVGLLGGGFLFTVALVTVDTNGGGEVGRLNAAGTMVCAGLLLLLVLPLLLPLVPLAWPELLLFTIVADGTVPLSPFLLLMQISFEAPFIFALIRYDSFSSMPRKCLTMFKISLSLRDC